MNRIFLAAALTLAAPLVVAPLAAAPVARHAAKAAAKAPVDWTRTIAATPRGFLVGNPAAPVKLVEYGSFTCSHCRIFQHDGAAALRSKYIAGGKVSFEFRSFVRNGPDYAVTLLAACDGPVRYAANVETLFANQDEWMRGFENIDPDTGNKLVALPQDKQVAALSGAGGFDRYMITRGLSAAKAQACLSDKAAADRLSASLKAAVETDKVDGTPGFLINGVRQVSDFAGQKRGVTTWAELEPLIVKALR